MVCRNKTVAEKLFCTNISTNVLLLMKIFSSSPYATFNPKEWSSVSKASYRFSNTPIQIKKKYFASIKERNFKKTGQENNDLPKQIQLILK